MTTTPATTDPATVATTTGVITCQDFSDRVTDTDRDRWTEGKIRHVMQAMAGRRVIITTDAGTGHTLFNVTIVGVRAGGHGESARVILESLYSDGTSSRTAFLIFQLGPVIIPMPVESYTDKRTKWAAMDSWREERSAALQVARNERDALGLTGGHGELRATPTAHDVAVSWEPERDRARREGVDMFDEAQRFWHITVTFTQVQAELTRRAEFAAKYKADREAERAAQAATD